MQVYHHGRALKIADAHAHIYPGKIAEKATASVGQFYDIQMDQVGYPHSLVESGDKIDVCKYLVCSVATKPEQSASINDFIYHKCQKYPSFLGFAALHPAQTDWAQEIERVCSLGLRGVKFHPDFQTFAIDDPHMLPVYQKIQEAGLVILFHMGDERYDYSSPKRLSNVLQQMPELTVIAAHFGGFSKWTEAARYLLFDNLYFDTSSTLWALDKDRARGLVHHFGAEKLLFGTDFPMWSHEEELERFLALNLTDEENDLILYKNFARLFQL